MSFDGRTKKFFAIAKKVAAKECDTDRVYRHGAVLIKGSTVRNSCANQNKCSSNTTRHNTTQCITSTMHNLHVELVAGWPCRDKQSFAAVTALGSFLMTLSVTTG